MLDELHRAGVIDDTELQEKRARVLGRDESPI